MEIRYDENEDILFIRFSKEKIVRDISYSWNINVGLTENGIGQITVLDAEAIGLLPVYVNPADVVKAA